jgi:filamentous hemagglutinin family protein
MLVAVAEDVTSQGKAPGEGNASSSSSPQSAKMGVIATMTAFALAMFASTPATSFAQALPTGGQVTAGQASISQNSNTMTINQGTQRAVIDWNSFNVGQGNTVQFNQPNAQAQALNRVTGAGASNIQGSLLANGQVLIQNANGVLFGKGAVVNVGSLLATTKSIDANQFMSGGPLKLSGTGKNASVVNDGTINAQGYVTLMGDQVRNTGSIDAGKNGQVALAAGDSATVVVINGDVNTDSGSTDISGNAANGDGVVINGDTNTTNNGSLNIDGNSSTNGDGVVINGDVNTDGHSSTDINGEAIDGNTSVIENGSLNIDGNSSKNGNGVVVNGDVDVSDNGHANIDGHANNGFRSRRHVPEDAQRRVLSFVAGRSHEDGGRERVDTGLPTFQP